MTWIKCFGDVMDINHDNITFTSTYLHFKKAWDDQFWWHHQNCSLVYEINLYRLKKSYKNLKLCIKMQSVSVFLDIANFSDSVWKNTDVSRNHGVCHVIHIFFISSLEQHVFGLPSTLFRLYPHSNWKRHFSQVAIRFLS